MEDFHFYRCGVNRLNLSPTKLKKTMTDWLLWPLCHSSKNVADHDFHWVPHWNIGFRGNCAKADRKEKGCSFFFLFTQFLRSQEPETTFWNISGSVFG